MPISIPTIRCSMKILYIIHDFLPKHQAGAEIYTYLLAKELSKEHEVCIFFTEITPFCKSYTVTKRTVDDLQCIEVFRPPVTDPAGSSYNDKKMEEIFTNILTDYKPDIIHLQHLLYHSLRYPAIAKQLNIPTLFTLHDYWLTCPRWGQRIKEDMSICHTIDLQKCSKCLYEKPSKVNLFSLSSICQFLHTCFYRPSDPIKRIDSLTKRRNQAISLSNEIDLFIAPSPFLLNEYTTFGVPEDKLLLSGHGFDKSGYTASKKTNSGKNIRFAFIGTINEHKGVHVLIEAFNNILEEKAELFIYGDLSWFPEYSTKLQKAATSPTISFKGAIPHDSVANILTDIDILVVPSIWFENSPLTIHEAFMSGIPVIASNLGGMADLVTDRKNGLLFEANNSDSLAETIQELVNSETLLNQLRLGIPTIKSIQDNGVEIEQIYQQLLTKYSGK
jgi:glycosyltransferase involved in cell wall biosynthesis